MSHEQQLMTSEGLTPSLDEITPVRSRPEQILRDHPMSSNRTQTSRRETSGSRQIRSYSKDLFYLFFSLREILKSLIGLLPRNWKNLLIIS